MRVLLNAFYCGCLLITLSVVSQAKDWRGLAPLRSSREDVEKLLGPPHPPPADGTWVYSMHEGRSIYHLDEGEVYIVYTNGRDPEWIDCAGKVPSGTVLLIQVTPKRGQWLTLRDLHLDEKRLKKFDPGYGEGYLDEEDGIVVRTYKGRVGEICYIATAKDKHLCPSYYERPEKFVAIIADPPFLDVVCPAEVEAGGRATLTVNISGGDPDVSPTFRWEVSPGKIVSGQGTSSIVIEGQESNARLIKATVEVGGYDPPLEASCEIKVIIKSEGNKRRHP